MSLNNNPRKKPFANHCGVPQCNSYKSKDVFLYHIPSYVQKSPQLLKKWTIILKMGKKFPSQFLICSRHFTEKEILIPIIRENKRLRTNLAIGAFPSRHLPKSVVAPRKKTMRSSRLKDNDTCPAVVSRRSSLEDISCLEDIIHQDSNSVGVQAVPETSDKSVQVNIKPYSGIASLWDSDKKFNTMTGIPRLELLETIVEICVDIRGDEICIMPMKDRILLTMYKLKSNCSLAELAISYQCSERTIKSYFADTIQLLAKVFKILIVWQTNEQNENSYPKYFQKFRNIKTVLDCTEFKTVSIGCLTCRTCTYSHYKGTYTLKVLIGVTPSGAINFVSKVATGKSSDKAIFNLTDLNLLSKLKPGYAVMVDKGFMIADELAEAGVEMVRPDFHFEKFSKECVEKNTGIASARVHVERRISRLKKFKVLSDKVDISIIPYIDDIVTIICGLSNVSAPILIDDRF